MNQTQDFIILSYIYGYARLLLIGGKRCIKLFIHLHSIFIHRAHLGLEQQIKHLLISQTSSLHHTYGQSYRMLLLYSLQEKVTTALAKLHLACLFNSVTLLLQTCVCRARCMKCFTGTTAALPTKNIPLLPKVPG